MITNSHINAALFVASGAALVASEAADTISQSMSDACGWERALITVLIGVSIPQPGQLLSKVLLALGYTKQPSRRSDDHPADDTLKDAR